MPTTRLGACRCVAPLLFLAAMSAVAQAQTVTVVLLGTGSPEPAIDRFGPGTLVEAGGQHFLFDAGRGVTQRLWQMPVRVGEITRVFLTHLHSDHTVGLADIWLMGWLQTRFGGRSTPLHVYGPAGTATMVRALREAYSVDVRQRSEAGIPDSVVAIEGHDITDGVVLERNGVRVTAFTVDHGNPPIPSLGYRLAFASRSVVIDYRWHCMISLRAQGRFRDALPILRRGPLHAAPGAILAMNLGEPVDAANSFLRLARESNTYYPQSSGRQARNLAWNLTLAGTAFAEAGDTSSVRRLVDSVEATGRRSLYVRDPQLHHFLRGLLLEKEARLDSAVQEFRAALTSPSLGYTRINYELGKSLIALNRPAEAIPVLRAPLHGGLDGPGLYLTRTETHELLAQAFDAAGQPDSATAHYAIVERAWRHADTSLQLRYAKVRARLTAVSASKPNVDPRRDPRRPRLHDHSGSSPE